MSSLEVWKLLSNRADLFMTPLEEDYFCIKCKTILLNPKLSNCGHHLCDECLSEIAKNNKGICPLDNELIESSFVDKSLKGKISKLKLKCPAFSYGCGWSGEIESVEIHCISECEHKLVPCELQCGSLLTKGTLGKHKSAECPERIISCEYCKQEMKSNELENHHNSYCTKMYIECPNRCIYAGMENKNANNNNNNNSRDILGEEVSESAEDQANESMSRNNNKNKNNNRSKSKANQKKNLSTSNLNNLGQKENPNSVIGTVYKLLREDLKAHFRLCPFEKIDCPIESCDEALERCNIEEHFKNNISSHFIALNEKNRESIKNFEFIKSDFQQTVNAHLEQIKRDRELYLPQISALAEQSEKLSSNIMQIKSINEINSMSVSKINGAITSIRNESQIFKNESENLKKEKDDLKQQISKLKAENEVFKRENEDLNSSLNLIYGKIEVLVKENQELLQKISNIETVLKPLPAGFVIWKLQMSSVYKNCTGTTYEKLISDDITQGGATNNATNQYIKCIFPSTVLIKKITLAQYCGLSKGTNGSSVQFSNDDVNYVNLFEVAGVTDAPKTFDFEPFYAKYVRLFKASGYVAVGILKFE